MFAKLLFKDNTLIPVYSNENGLCVTVQELYFGNIPEEKLVLFMEDLKLSKDNITDFYLSIPFQEGIQELATSYCRTKLDNIPVKCSDQEFDWSRITDQEVSFFKRLHKLTQTILCFK